MSWFGNLSDPDQGRHLLTFFLVRLRTERASCRSMAFVSIRSAIRRHHLRRRVAHTSMQVMRRTFMIGSSGLSFGFVFMSNNWRRRQVSLRIPLGPQQQSLPQKTQMSMLLFQICRVQLKQPSLHQRSRLRSLERAENPRSPASRRQTLTVDHWSTR